MANLLRINKIEELKKYETHSKKTKYEGIKSTIETPLVIKKGDRGFYTSNEWFINHLGELIFDIKRNQYIVPYYYDNGSSVVEDIYVVVE